MSSPARIVFYPFAEGAALHREGSHRLWVLNHSSAVLWCLREEHATGGRLVKSYADYFGLSVEEAELDVRTALIEFERVELLSETPDADFAKCPDLAPETGLSAMAPVKAEDQSPGAALRPQAAGFWQKTFQIAGIFWQITCTNADTARRCFNCFSHLETEPAAADLHYQLSANGSGWTLTGTAGTISNLAADEVLPRLLTLLFAELCARQPQRLLLHAAAAWRDGRLLLLPGESTFGKSTLAAAMAANGWTLYSDELAPLDPATLLVAPFPLPVGIKSRSLPALQACYPQLAAQPAWRRADGLLVRYLAPPQLSLADPAAIPAPVATLVFPCYRPDGPTRLQRLTPLAALARLSRTGSSERPLLANDVNALLALAGQLPCWSLDYANLEEALQAIVQTSNPGQGWDKLT